MHGREVEVAVIVDDFLSLVQTCKNKGSGSICFHFLTSISVAHLEEDPEVSSDRI